MSDPAGADRGPEGGAPRSFAALRDLLLERRATLPKRLAQVADFALDNPDDMAFGTVAAVADLAGVQPSTLVRFAQALGYEGFSDLQTVFHALLRNRWPDYEERLRALSPDSAAGPAALLAGFCESASLSLSRLQERTSGEALERAVDVLAGADTIYVLGQRRTFAVAAYFAYAFAKLKIRCVLVDNVGSLGPDQVAFAEAKDALLAVSFAPYTPSTIEIAERLASRLPVVAITDSPFSPLVASARVWFEVAEADFGAFRAVSGTFALAMTLAVAVGQRRAKS
ncbi:MurR/RpiR family transcriptional regulator [Lichenibacterium ramalinae]|uniref:MurR/RpiR family transcriptional regulator n=1 Tax=Lichenibacterium ramalinae TaxID=2316527 RepID=A0A4Q2RIG6_9HYPH|nr:MurR/RpiR family transcriptional regulator [Lichenibacterium ramalinae]RYB07060.1 MurR/RpiR family transcriptional regulator [Lichenibacterium ramalinae]